MFLGPSEHVKETWRELSKLGEFKLAVMASPYQWVSRNTRLNGYGRFPWTSSTCFDILGMDFLMTLPVTQNMVIFPPFFIVHPKK